MLTPKARRELPWNLSAPSIARRFSREHCCPHMASLVGEVALVVSELVSNAVLYAAPPLLVSLDCIDGRALRAVVHDGTAGLETERAVRRPSTFEDDFGDIDGLLESGRGFVLIDEVASTWGVEPPFGPPVRQQARPSSSHTVVGHPLQPVRSPGA